MRPGDPVAQWVGHLLEGAGETIITCARCGRQGRVTPILEHAFNCHQVSLSEAATWLERADADLFSLAVHYLTSKDRALRTA